MTDAACLQTGGTPKTRHAATRPCRRPCSAPEITSSLLANPQPPSNVRFRHSVGRASASMPRSPGASGTYDVIIRFDHTFCPVRESHRRRRPMAWVDTRSVDPDTITLPSALVAKQ